MKIACAAFALLLAARFSGIAWPSTWSSARLVAALLFRGPKIVDSVSYRRQRWAIIFGAIFPDVVSWFIVAPLKGLPVGYGFHFPGLLVGPIVNGLWGLGTAVILNGRLSIDPLLR